MRTNQIKQPTGDYHTNTTAIRGVYGDYPQNN